MRSRVTGRALPVVVSVPTAELQDALADCTDAEVLLWDLRQPAPRKVIDQVVVPYMSSPDLLSSLVGRHDETGAEPMIGFDGVAHWLPPGARLSNAAGIHEASTAELAIGLMIASQRRLPACVRDQVRQRWNPTRSMALSGARIVVIGQGGVRRAVIDRLAPFEVETVRVASAARKDENGTVHSIAELPGLLSSADIVQYRSRRGKVGERQRLRSGQSHLLYRSHGSSFG